MTTKCGLMDLIQGSHSDWKTWKTWKNGKAFSSQGKVREFWTDWKSQGKVRENHTKYWKTWRIWNKYYMIFLMIFKWTVYYLLKWIKFSVYKIRTLEKYWKKAKNTGKVREFCQSRKVGTLIYPTRHFYICNENKNLKIFYKLMTHSKFNDCKFASECYCSLV